MQSHERYQGEPASQSAPTILTTETVQDNKCLLFCPVAKFWGNLPHIIRYLIHKPSLGDSDTLNLRTSQVLS